MKEEVKEPIFDEIKINSEHKIYSISENDIKKEFGQNKAEKFNAALISKIENISPSRYRDFLDYQLSKVDDQLNWLQQFDDLIWFRLKHGIFLGEWDRNRLKDFPQTLREYTDEFNRNKKQDKNIKIITKLSAQELALLFQLLNEKGLIIRTTKAEMARLISRNFSDNSGNYFDEDYIKKILSTHPEINSVDRLHKIFGELKEELFKNKRDIQ